MYYENSFVFNEKKYYYCDLKKVFEEYPLLKVLPNSLKLILENSINNCESKDIKTIIEIFLNKSSFLYLYFKANRVIIKDYYSIPAFIEIVSINEILKKRNNTNLLEPKLTVDLVMNIHKSKNEDSNIEKYEFSSYLEQVFSQLNLISSNNSDTYRINLEYLATIITLKQKEDKTYISFEALAGSDYQTTMISSLGIVGLRVSEIQTQSAILGSSINFLYPKVLGINIQGSLAQGVCIVDVLFYLEELFKQNSVKNKIIEFYGKALNNISIEDRASISNMLCKYGVLCSYFCLDLNTITFIEQTRGVDASLIKHYYSLQGIYNTKEEELDYDERIDFDLSSIKAYITGPKSLSKQVCIQDLEEVHKSSKKGEYIKDNDILLAFITFSNSYLSTSNPSLIIQAALLAKNAYNLGLRVNTNIKKYFIFNCIELKQYLEKLDLLKYLELLGFELLDTCTSYNDLNTLSKIHSLDIEKFNLDVCFLSFGIIEENDLKNSLNPYIKSNWQMSPALIIAYCLRGNMNFDISTQSINKGIYLSDLWPSFNEINEYINKIDYCVYKDVYKDVFTKDKESLSIEYKKNSSFLWNKDSSTIIRSDLFDDISLEDKENISIKDAKILALFEDKISSEEIAPLGLIPLYSPAAKYLEHKGIKTYDLGTFKSRYFNTEIMSRSIFCSISIKNQMVKPKEGAYTKDYENNEIMTIYEFSKKMRDKNTALVILAQEEFGIGEKRAWASKGLKALGVKVIIAKSFDSYYKKDLIANGILPCELISDDLQSLNLKGDERISIKTKTLEKSEKIQVEIKRGAEVSEFTVLSKLETNLDLYYYKKGGVLASLVKTNIKQ